MLNTLNTMYQIHFRKLETLYRLIIKLQQLVFLALAYFTYSKNTNTCNPLKNTIQWYDLFSIYKRCYKTKYWHEKRRNPSPQRMKFQNSNVIKQVFVRRKINCNLFSKAARSRRNIET